MDKNTGKPTIQPNRRTASAEASGPVEEALTEARAQAHIEHCREVTCAFAYRLFPEFWQTWSQSPAQMANTAASNKDQTKLWELHRLLTARRQSAEQGFCQIIGDNFLKFSDGTLAVEHSHKAVSAPAEGGAALSLVDPSDLEESIAIDSVVNRADVALAEPLWALNQRFALLNGGHKVEEKGNPASPVQFCEALRKLIDWDDLDMRLRIVGYKLFDRLVVQRLDELYTDLNAYLVANKLLPNLRYSTKQEGGSAAQTPGARQIPRRRTTDRMPGSGAADLQFDQSALLGAIRQLQNHLGDAGGPVAGAVGNQGYTSEQLVAALQDMQVRAVSSGQVDAAGLQPWAMSRDVLVKLAGEDSAAQLKDKDRHTIDLVGMLFEFMLADDNLPDTVKTLLSYLHTPFLKIAFIDQMFLERDDHPARVLLDSLAEAGSRWVSNDGTSQYDIYNKIKATVFRLLEEFESDMSLLDELVKDFQDYTSAVARRQTLVERRALEKMQGEETLREAKILVNTEVQNRIAGRDLPSAILLLLLQPWSDYLSFVQLRYGQDSEHWTQALFVMDELLWSVEPKVLQVDKERLEKYRGKLIQALEGAFEAICYEHTRGRKLLDSIESLQDLALKSRRLEPAPSAMRTRLESMVAERVGSILDTADITPEEAEILDKLKLIEFGTWLEMQGGQRVKVAWYNRKTLNYMLVDQLGNKVSVTTGLQLARQMIAGEARIIAGSAKPFFERALENIYNKLNTRADALRED